MTSQQTGADDAQAAETASETDTATGAGEDSTVVLQTRPTVRPVVIRLLLTVVLGLIAIAVFYLQPELLGSTENTNVALVVTQVVVLVAALRLLVKIIVLKATRYVLTERSVRRQFQLLARSKSREVPYDLIRSQERSQGRIEYLLGVGSVAVNQGLGDLRLEMLTNHEEVYEQIRDRVEAE